MSPALLLLIPVCPALGALALALFGRRLPYNVVSSVAVAAVSAAFALVLAFALGFSDVHHVIEFSTGPWLATQAFQADFTFKLDSISLCMCLLVSGFGALITLYSVGYMRDDKEQSRFFASLNLFVTAMLILVLADNLVLIFLGWEGVGLCSYLLIGHYWEEKDVPLAAFRALFVNRIGDILFLLGVFTLFGHFGTASLVGISTQATQTGYAGWGALLILGGAFAKSAQAPLHVWLADAMAGPTPVSALIHAATMVTAGIYLVMRLQGVFTLSPEANFVMVICALITLVLGALMALTQTDIKKILAYSTLSNLSLMFLALSVLAPGSAMMHLFGHACFKALLFLAAGSVIFAAHHEQDVHHLGGVLKKLPVTRIAFWVGCIGGAGLIPYLAAGFFSKELILESIKEGHLSGFGFSLSADLVYWIVVVVECISALYLFRLLGYLSGDKTYHEDAHHPVKEKSLSIRLVLGILIVVGPVFGYLSATPLFGGKGFIYSAITGGTEQPEGPSFAHALPFLILNLVLAGICFFVFSSAKRRESLPKLSLGQYGPLARKFYFDDLYEYIFVKPLKVLGIFSRLILENIFIGSIKLAGWLGFGSSYLIRRYQTGNAQQYALGFLVAIFLLIVFLAKG